MEPLHNRLCAALLNPSSRISVFTRQEHDKTHFHMDRPYFLGVRSHVQRLRIAGCGISASHASGSPQPGALLKPEMYGQSQRTKGTTVLVTGCVYQESSSRSYQSLTCAILEMTLVKECRVGECSSRNNVPRQLVKGVWCTEAVPCGWMS